MELNFLYNVAFAGIIQGFFLSIFILLFAKHRTRASMYLGILILFVTLTILQELIWESELLTGLQYYLIYLPYPFACPALLYFFVMTFLYPDRKNTQVEKMLYLPFYLILVIFLISKVLYLSIDLEHPLISVTNTILNSIDLYGDLLSIITFSIVLVLLRKAIKQYQDEPVIYHSSILKSKLAWLKTLIILQLVFICFWLYASIHAALMDEYDYSENLLLVTTSILIYILGYIGTRKIGVQEERKKIRQVSLAPKNNSFTKTLKNKHILELERILIKEKKFLDPTITLETLAEELQLSKSHLSRIINTELNSSFTDYVNALRITEAKKLLLNPEFSNYTLVAIGLESGFNSKTTFNTTFKKITKQTPSQFRQSHNN